MVRLKAAPAAMAATPFRFQFLMVRLKAFPQYGMSLCCKISIPYGSIKSPPASLRMPVPSAFQFLMVRLKVIIRRKQQ